jgi:nucleotide-binding universal stress UspA family protein
MFEEFLQAGYFDQDQILGLHVVLDEASLHDPAIQQMRERFQTCIHEKGLDGDFACEVGSNPIQIINKRAAWVDAVIAYGNRPPGDPALVRISPEMKLLVQGCPCPIQVRPQGGQSDYSRGILAYDGSPRADEALFIATYLTSRWKRKLTVVTVETAYTKPSALKRARKYLSEHGVKNATYVLKKGPIADNVLETAVEHDCNLLFMGGFSFRSLRHLSLGSSAEQVLREFPYPMWISR